MRPAALHSGVSGQTIPASCRLGCHLKQARLVVTLDQRHRRLGRGAAAQAVSKAELAQSQAGVSPPAKSLPQTSQPASDGVESNIGSGALPEDSRLRPIRRDLARAVDSLPKLPAHLQHMAGRPWVMAMQLRWVRANLVEEKLEKEAYVEQLQQQLTHAKFARTAMDSHAARLQNEIVA
ncbi:hypothetical protein WJX73_007341 [Symbiochloris irregularis]|uniref:Uncharacterized protein n=1 Tax=Symbiochloris irregularis TaxID=706552 RepID=A0AAW1NWK1_9CHLO